MKALYPIKKEFVMKIFDGSKAYEYRKHLCSDLVDKIVIYESCGRGLVVGEFDVVGRIGDTPHNLWNRTKDYAGISEEDFFKYFANCKMAYAYVIGNVNMFLKPKSLQDYKLKNAPQNFVYVE